MSPHCIRRCRELIEGTRQLAVVRGGKREDVLQLKTMMMCAWEEMVRWREHQQNIDTTQHGEDKTGHSSIDQSDNNSIPNNYVQANSHEIAPLEPMI